MVLAYSQLVAVQSDNAADTVRLRCKAGCRLLARRGVLGNRRQRDKVCRQHLIDGGEIAALEKVPAGCETRRAVREKGLRRDRGTGSSRGGSGESDRQCRQGDQRLAAGKGV